MHRQTVKGKIDGKITAGKLPKAHRWNRPLTPPRSGLVQRRVSQILQDLPDGEFSSILASSVAAFISVHLITRSALANTFGGS